MGVEGVTKSFGAVQALREASFSVGRGEIVALLGENGAGKSTLLRILATTVLPDGGRATVAGRDVVADPVGARTRSGFLLPDERSWYWRLSGRRNLEFFAALHGMKKPAARERADELLGRVGLADAADRRFDGYSSGMRLRLSLARALLADPPVLLLDEPTRSLDPVAKHAFQEHVERLRDERGAAILFATHDLHEASLLATRTVILARGRSTVLPDRRLDPGELQQALVGAAA